MTGFTSSTNGSHSN